MTECSGSVRHLEQDFSACTLIGNCVPQVYSSNPGRGRDEPSVSSEFHKDIYFLFCPTWKPTLIIIFEHYVQNQRIYIRRLQAGNIQFFWNHKLKRMKCYVI